MDILRSILRKLESNLIQGKAWVFITSLGFGSYMFMHVFGRLHWGVFFYYWVVFLFLFFPSWIHYYILKSNPGWTPNWKRLFWLACFVLPLVLYFIWQPNLRMLPWAPEGGHLRPKIEPYFLPFLGVGLIASDLLLRLSDFLTSEERSSRWWRKLSLEHFLLFTMGALSFLFGWTFAFTEDVPAWDLAPLGRFGMGFGFGLQFMAFFLAAFFFYFLNAHYLVPRLLGERGIVYYLFGLALTILLFYPPIGWVLTFLPILQDLSMMPEGFDRPGQANLIMGVGAYPLLIMLAPTPFLLSLRWFKQNSELAELSSQQMETELSLLKQQINPHFFFNTLNNLYALSLAKDEQTPEVVMRLAELMRYVIYRGREATVSLAEEVKYLEDYVALQQIRLHEELHLEWEVSLANPNVQVGPLLFIVLVENAFKHGIEADEGSSELRVQIEEQNNRVVLLCENSCPEKDNDHQPGIGLENLRRRLELLYPNRFDLDIQRTPGWFSVRLSLQLESE